MKHFRSHTRFLILAVLVTLLGSGLICTSVVKAFTITKNEYVYDGSGLFTPEEKAKLNDSIQKISDENKIDILIITTDDDLGYTPEDYLSEFKHEACDVQQLFSKDCILLYINLTNRDVDISGYGRLKNVFPDSTIAKIGEKITPSLKGNEFYKAANVFVSQVNIHLTKDFFYFKAWFQLIVAVAAGGIIVAIIAFRRKTPITTSSATYLDQQNSRIRFHHDNYIRTVVTKTKKPENKSSSSGGGHSGSGGSHSNWSGKF